ncbi:unnamed protein product [Triticum turgidum subsp. durum]|uniref:X8 domain-containing protein n=1 Tax=Triticum turgidum subsp. durum TaxID=4567 RepID=A0A9R0T777_TRITD|nr:unnamed protein product [Triticum turgidum subsp. durum]
MLRERWQGCVLVLVLLLLSNAASGTSLGDDTILPTETEDSPSDLAKIVHSSKQTKRARVCGGADHRLLRSLADTGAEVMVSIPSSRLQHMAEFREEARLWVAANVAPFVPATMITHVLAGDDVLSSGSGSPGDAYSLVPAMLNLHAALGFSGIPLIAAEPEGLDGALVYRSYSHHTAGGGGGRRSLASGTFCVALQNADPTALQAGLSWACGQGQADCSAIQPGGACYKQNNLAALASYAYNDYYQKGSSTGATCSFNGTATTTTTDPSSGSCVFAGSSMAGGSNSSVPSASPPTSLAPPSGGLTPPVGSSPPSDFGPPPTGFGPPAGGFGPPTGFGPPSAFGPPGSFNGSGTFGPSGTLEPYGIGCRHVASLAASTLVSAVVLAVLVASPDLM